MSKIEHLSGKPSDDWKLIAVLFDGESASEWIARRQPGHPRQPMVEHRYYINRISPDLGIRVWEIIH